MTLPLISLRYTIPPPPKGDYSRNAEYWQNLENYTVQEAACYQRDQVAEEYRNAPNAPIFQWYALQQIKHHKSLFEAGDSLALLDAIQQCALHGLPLPEWVAGAYIDGYRKIIHFEVKTLDAAFGAPFPKGANLNAKRKKWRTAIQVYVSVKNESNRGRAIDDTLFEEIGRQFNIGKTLAKEYYARHKNEFSVTT